MNKLKLARLICKQAHKGQYDRGGKPYYLHPYTVADLCKRRKDKIVAYLHDVIEDTNVTYYELRACGFGETILAALKAITHIKSMPYMEYLAIVKTNKIATRVKIADMIHNSDISRIHNPTEKDKERCQLYLEYIKYLRQK